MDPPSWSTLTFLSPSPQPPALSSQLSALSSQPSALSVELQDGRRLLSPDVNVDVDVEVDSYRWAVARWTDSPLSFRISSGLYATSRYQRAWPGGEGEIRCRLKNEEWRRIEVSRRVGVGRGSQARVSRSNDEGECQARGAEQYQNDPSDNGLGLGTSFSSCRSLRRSCLQCSRGCVHVHVPRTRDSLQSGGRRDQNRLTASGRGRGGIGAALKDPRVWRRLLTHWPSLQGCALRRESGRDACGVG